MNPLHLRTLGAVELRDRANAPEPLLRGVKPLLVPTVLATLPGAEADRGYLADLIWPGEDRKRSKASLRQALHHLGKYGEGAGVTADNGRIRIDRDALDVDLWRFEEAVRNRDHEAAIEAYGGAFCAGIQGRIGGELQRWIDSQNDRIQVALEAAYFELIGEDLRVGALARALRYAQDFANSNPLSDKAQLTLIRTLHAAGESVRALQVYEGFRSLLESELGGRISPEVESTLERLREEAIHAPEPTPGGIRRGGARTTGECFRTARRFGARRFGA